MKKVSVELKLNYEGKIDIQNLRMLEKYNFIDLKTQKNYVLTELKASMRFWFRAFNPMNIKILWEIEGILFGNSEKNKSPLGIKLSEKIKDDSKIVKLDLTLNQYIEEQYRKLRIENESEIEMGLTEEAEKDTEKNEELRKKYILKALNIVLSAQRGLEWYKNLLELSIILGGIGKNARKNKGNFIFDELKYTDVELIDRIEKLINVISFDNTKTNGLVCKKIENRNFEDNKIKEEYQKIDLTDINYSHVLKIKFFKQRYEEKTMKIGNIRIIKEIQAKNHYEKGAKFPSPIYYSSYLTKNGNNIDTLYIITLLEKIKREGELK